MSRALFSSGVEFRDSQREQYQFRVRLGVLSVLVICMFLVLLVRFAFLQIKQHEHYQTLAEANRIAILPSPPGQIGRAHV